MYVADPGALVLVHKYKIATAEATECDDAVPGEPVADGNGVLEWSV